MSNGNNTNLIEYQSYIDKNLEKYFSTHVIFKCSFDVYKIYIRRVTSVGTEFYYIYVAIMLLLYAATILE